MVEKIILNLVDNLVDNNIIELDKKDMYMYALICEIESAITIGSIIIVAIIIRKLFLTICFLFSFLSLRNRTGGYHLNCFSSCYIGTIGIYGLVICICESLSDQSICLGILTLFSILCITIIGTINHPNMDMSLEEINASKKLARCTLIINVVICGFLFMLNVNRNVVKYFQMGIIVCAILLLLAKITGQELETDG